MGSFGVLRYSNLHVLVVPYPSQGHINPMLQFAKRLASKNFQVTFVTTEENREQMLRAQDAVPGASNSSLKVQFETISDGLPLDFDRWNNRQIRSEMLCKMGGLTLTNLIERLNAQGNNICCVVYDSFLYWIPEVAKKFNIPLAFFWTQSCAVYSIYYHFNRGLAISWDGTEKPTDLIEIPGLPLLNLSDLPLLNLSDLKTGLRVNKRSANGLVGKEDVEKCIKMVMESELGVELRENALRWKKLSREAMGEAGSSNENIEEFVEDIVSRASSMSLSG